MTTNRDAFQHSTLPPHTKKNTRTSIRNSPYARKREPEKKKTTRPKPNENQSFLTPLKEGVRSLTSSEEIVENGNDEYPEDDQILLETLAKFEEQVPGIHIPTTLGEVFSNDEYPEEDEGLLLSALAAFEDQIVVKEESSFPNSSSFSSSPTTSTQQLLDPHAIKPEPATKEETPSPSSLPPHLPPENATIIQDLLRTHAPSSYIFPFKKYPGMRVCDIPRPYLHWILNNTQLPSQDPLLAAALTHMGIFKTEPPTPPPPPRDRSNCLPNWDSEWQPPSIYSAPSIFRDRWDDTNLWVSKTDQRIIFNLSESEISKLPRAKGEVKMKSSWLYHVWHFVSVRDGREVAGRLLGVFLEKYQRAIEDVWAGMGLGAGL